MNILDDDNDSLVERRRKLDLERQRIESLLEKMELQRLLQEEMLETIDEQDKQSIIVTSSSSSSSSPKLNPINVAAQSSSRKDELEKLNLAAESAHQKQKQAVASMTKTLQAAASLKRKVLEKREALTKAKKVKTAAAASILKSAASRSNTSALAPIAAVSFPSPATSIVLDTKADVLSVLFRITLRHVIQHQKRIRLHALETTFESYTGKKFKDLNANSSIEQFIRSSPNVITYDPVTTDCSCNYYYYQNANSTNNSTNNNNIIDESEAVENVLQKLLTYLQELLRSNITIIASKDSENDVAAYSISSLLDEFRVAELQQALNITLVNFNPALSWIKSCDTTSDTSDSTSDSTKIQVEFPVEERYYTMTKTTTTPSTMVTLYDTEKESPLLKLRSKKYGNRIDVMKILCPFELNGICNDDHCEYQHEKQYALMMSSQEESVVRTTTARDESVSSSLILSQKNEFQRFLLALRSRKLPTNEDVVILPVFIQKALGGRKEKLVTSTSTSVKDCVEDTNEEQHEGFIKMSNIDNIKSVNVTRYYEHAGNKKVLQSRVEENPNDITSWLLLALESIECFTIPDYVMSLEQVPMYKLSCCLSSSLNNDDVGEFKKALHVLSRALEANPSDESIWILYLFIFKKLNDTSSALLAKLCRQAIANVASTKLLWKLYLSEIFFPVSVLDKFATFEDVTRSEEFLIYDYAVLCFNSGYKSKAIEILLRRRTYRHLREKCDNQLLALEVMYRTNFVIFPKRITFWKKKSNDACLKHVMEDVIDEFNLEKVYDVYPRLYQLLLLNYVTVFSAASKYDESITKFPMVAYYANNIKILCTNTNSCFYYYEFLKERHHNHRDSSNVIIRRWKDMMGSQTEELLRQWYCDVRENSVKKIDYYLPLWVCEVILLLNEEDNDSRSIESVIHILDTSISAMLSLNNRTDEDDGMVLTLMIKKRLSLTGGKAIGWNEFKHLLLKYFKMEEEEDKLEILTDKSLVSFVTRAVFKKPSLYDRIDYKTLLEFVFSITSSSDNNNNGDDDDSLVITRLYNSVFLKTSGSIDDIILPLYCEWGIKNNQNSVVRKTLRTRTYNTTSSNNLVVFYLAICMEIGEGSFYHALSYVSRGLKEFPYSKALWELAFIIKVLGSGSTNKPVLSSSLDIIPRAIAATRIRFLPNTATDAYLKSTTAVIILPLSQVFTTKMITTLDISRNTLVYLPTNKLDGTCFFPSLESLNLSHNSLVQLPSHYISQTLTFLDVSHNNLLSLPADIGLRASKCKVLNVNVNLISSLPMSIGSMTSLRELHVAFNNVSPKVVKRLVKLLKQKDLKVNLQGNLKQQESKTIYLHRDLGDCSICKKHRGRTQVFNTRVLCAECIVSILRTEI